MKIIPTALLGLALLGAVFISSAAFAANGGPTGGGGGASTSSGGTLNHTLPLVSGPLACTTTNSLPFWDWYGPGTLTASVVYTLPTSGCPQNAVIGIRLIQGASAYTESVSTSAAGGIVPANCPTLGSSAGNTKDHYFQWSSGPATWTETCGPPANPSGGSTYHTVVTSGNAQAIAAACTVGNSVDVWDVTLTHTFTAPTITVGGSCSTSQQEYVYVTQDSTGGIQPAWAGTIAWQGDGGSPPTITTAASNRAGFHFLAIAGVTMLEYPYLPNTAPNYSLAGACPAGQIVIANGTTGPTCAAESVALCVYGSATGACPCTAGTCTYTPPAGTSLINALLTSSGQGGGGTQSGGAAAHSGAGGAGGCIVGLSISGVIEPTYTVVLGAGGTAGACGVGATNVGGVQVNSTLTSANWTVTLNAQNVAGVTTGTAATTTTDGVVTSETNCTAGASVVDETGFNGALVARTSGSAGLVGGAGSGSTIGKSSLVTNPGGNGGSVGSAGTCSGAGFLAATAGQNGFAQFIARGIY